ncbi:hypothetical protein BAE44_0023032 [Dichanthelium oligosanthes]|uniref:Uncharacterized protein n=1 Tax=Dichanthelium oligosanthes TaxID=888268 RepID=A0A1E5USW2_9POAL|nr:hypothetical protein BAE44_0023032 [Dichanthelium oligosanthes]
MSAAVVTKSSPVLVVPSESATATPPVAGDTVALSSFDLCMLPFPMKLLLAFDRPIHQPVEMIKRALSRALAHYHPVAGRLDGNGGIACTGEGVAFVTEFSCGGFAVGVTWNHVLADGARIRQFLRGVVELATGVSPPSVVLVRHRDDSLVGLPASMVAAQRSTVDNDGPGAWSAATSPSR